MTPRPVGIADFSLLTVLGDDHASQRQALLAGSQAGLVADTHYLRGRLTQLGRLKTTLPTLPSTLATTFDVRANRLLMRQLDLLSSTIEQQKSRYPLNRIGVIMATSTAGLDNLERALPQLDRSGQWPADYHSQHQRMGLVSAFVARYTGVLGPVMSVATACSSGNKALASAKRWLNAGICDAVICGGVDVLTTMTLRGFDALGALSADLPQPFSQNRCGINIGEAAAVFVLTKTPTAINLLATGESSDAHHISAPEPQGRGAMAAMQQALDNAGISSDAIDYINLHGTGTPQNDRMEAAAIHRVFTDAASHIPCSSCKPQIGHTLGVSGLSELGLCLLAMTAEPAQLVLPAQLALPPHIFDGQYDSEILPLHLVERGQRGRLDTVLSNSFAFGGSNATVIVGRG
ncbi:MAG: beta-ketoacyl-[acyl-carrier-protein] synthase II [Gammaproteobacteria bacterium]|nr:MAG: beta-ketoacyl-[acyl-carrier-protein] synthase II [Gammaproteobacteria bacterium]